MKPLKKSSSPIAGTTAITNKLTNKSFKFSIFKKARIKTSEFLSNCRIHSGKFRDKLNSIKKEIKGVTKIIRAIESITQDRVIGIFNPKSNFVRYP